MENITTKNKINKLIKGAYQDLHDFHQNTFGDEFAELTEKTEFTGEDINEYMYDMEMTAQEDACYLAGKIDMLKHILLLLKENKKTIRIGLTYEDLEDLMADKSFDWTLDDVDVHLYNEDENPN